MGRSVGVGVGEHRRGMERRGEGLKHLDQVVHDKHVAAGGVAVGDDDLALVARRAHLVARDDLDARQVLLQKGWVGGACGGGS